MNQESPPTYALLDLEDLQFDSEPPRFPTAIGGSHRDEVLTFMLEDAGLIDLMRSIASQGFFPGEPVLVSPSPSTPGKWVVVEGNRRLAACLLLQDPQLAPTNKRAVAQVAQSSLGHPQLIPSLQFEKRMDILKHLGYRHVTGIKEWGPLAKAKFLQQRFNAISAGSDVEKLRDVARSIGSRSDYVGRLLTASSIFSRIEVESYFNLEGLNESSLDFSLITSALAYSNIVEYLGLDSSQDMDMSSLKLDNLKRLTQIMFGKVDGRKTILGESRNIRKLADIVLDARARAVLESGATLEQAWRSSGGGNEAFRSLVEGAQENLQLASRPGLRL